MTTAREVRRWTKGILAEHNDLVLNARELYLEPVQHIYRAISFIGSSERAFSRPTVVFGALFAPLSVPMSYTLGLELIVGYSTDADFAVTLSDAVREALDHTLRPLSSIQAFHDVTLDDHLMGKATDHPRLRSPLLQVALLAALGLLDKAFGIAESYIEQETKTLADQLPQRDGVKSEVAVPTWELKRLEDMRRLRDLVESGDRRGMGALLRTWEHQRVRRLGIEHLWKPTPFPVEEQP